MISRIVGKLTRVNDTSALIENGGVYYEVLLPSALADRLKNNGQIGHEIAFETIYYIEAGDKKASHFPKLVGFTNPIDREFFSILTQVPGLGVKKALKSLVMPIKDIASAIETKDAARLNRLPGVGARLAEKIVAELNGKVAKFALARDGEPLTRDKTRSPEFADEALDVLTQLQYSRVEAERMIQAALRNKPKVNKVEDLIAIVFRNEQQKTS